MCPHGDGYEGGAIEMGFIPKNAHRYLADLILEYTIDEDRRNVVYVNTD
jgi:hypothetical protein